MSASDFRKLAVRRAFEHAATTYDAAARVQREAAQSLAAFASEFPPLAPPRFVLDAGCGTGYALPELRSRFPHARLLALDFSTAMLARATRDFPAAPLCADIERLPLADGCVDLYWSSLALQWCDPAAALAEVARVLTPGGVAWIATLGPYTLTELRTAFAAVDDDVHVIDFSSPSFWQAACRDAGLVVEAHGGDARYDFGPDLRALLGNIKAIGARTVGEKRRRRTLGKQGWQTLQAAYEAFRRPDGLLPATYDLILLALRKPA
ncbi:MAG: malonyl-ACP O-methyltransferase BioC [Azoarcus sp.]|jgi:malonyl-CoA O-methyltransferase|nr:malonyl-ACP O-methyltransferase BioC [Azoarcus sp.]